MAATMNVTYEIRKTAEYEKWFAEQSEKTKLIVDARLQRIAVDGHFGMINVFDGLIELKWKSGLRIYTHRFGSKVLIVLLGGNKNDQDHDIRQAKKILARLLEET